MKKILVLFTVLSVALTSCSNDDDNFTSEDLIGNWQCTEVTYTGSVTVTVNGQSSKANIVGNGLNVNNMTTRFNDAPKTLFTQGRFNLELVVTINGVDEVHPAPSQQLLVGDSWVQNSSKLTIYNNGEEEVYHIDELLPSTMTLTTSQKETVVIDGQTTTVDFEVVAKYRSVN
ncbi:hypothetical protein JJL45_12725 [Tamlana sp. s12]|uniref:hypothetical protein n=1 Tax=Tamlana sp. s12 TaxID=1630406 RepID=UPI0007FF1CCD|nr:hypothetical protein [Tamlana sp. s12]OBQ56585.1 hypothetical protein VQ01_04370 [Tamlana sp. s12]QQY81778.1 hypothetical protein JJL45_12725 [Tamlana sp. s12]